MTKPNKDGWFRHRGGKCPVEKGTMVDVRYRNHNIVLKHFKTAEQNTGEAGLKAIWSHKGDEYDIMAWRPHKADRSKIVDDLQSECEAVVSVANSLSGPIQWRDRIREIDAASKEEEARHCTAMAAYDEERTSLVARLKAEGFALIQGDEPNSVEESDQQDMSDWRNWKEGDICEVIDSNARDPFSTGQLVELLESGSMAPYCKLAGDDRWAMAACQLKWRSRPTN